MIPNKFHSTILAFSAVSILAGSLAIHAADCNQNGIDDAADLLPGELRFLAAPVYPAGEAGEWLNTLIDADFNGDGHRDLATSHLGCTGCDPPLSGEVSVLFNKGDGTFHEAVTYPVQGGWSLITADLNGDGSPDLATANSNPDAGVISVLLNGGDGTFHSTVDYPVEVYPGDLAASDLNGDGRLDLVTIHQWPGVVSVLFNEGGGVFQDAVKYSVGMYPFSMIATDLNGDGKIDLATANRGCSDGWGDPPGRPDVSVLLNQGAGKFQDAVSYSIGIEDECFQGTIAPLVASDWNGDGSVDLAMAYSGTVAVLLNRGDGSFGEAVRHAAGGDLSVGLVALLAADFDGDGYPDLAIIGAYQDDLSVLLNRGNGTFHDAVNNVVGYGFYNSITADFNGDRRPDLALSALSGDSVLVLINQGDGAFQEDASYTIWGGNLIAADLNGDGNLDLATGESGVSVLLNQGDGSFRASRSYLAACWPSALVSSDFNGDGMPDLATVDSNTIIDSDIFVLLNRGDGTFHNAEIYPVGGGHSAFLAATDFNGDGMPDLATVNANESLGRGIDISVLLNRGDGTFHDAEIYPAGGRFPKSLVAIDLNGDGMPDLATSKSIPESISVLLNRGDGTFYIAWNYSGKGGVSLVAADLNGDGGPDLVAADESGLTFFFNDGDGRFHDIQIYPGEGGLSLFTADLNGDGSPDLATCDGSDLTVFLNNGEGAFLDTRSYPGGGGILVAADLNGDGMVDLATTKVRVLLNLGDGSFHDAGQYQYPAYESPVSLITADFNGDRRPDLAAAYEIGLFGGTCRNVSIVLNETEPPFSLDLNRNGVPDECEERFRRGDVDGNGALELTDVIRALNFVFADGEPLDCLDAADIDDNGELELTDMIRSLNYQFTGTAAGPEPPGSFACGIDPTNDFLTCESYTCPSDA